MIRAALAWLLSNEPTPIPVESGDRDLLRSVLWGLPADAPCPTRRRFHLRNLAARGLLELSHHGRDRYWTLTEIGARVAHSQASR
jgi:hypothetical protein